jgi:hypothetical protein
MFKKVINSFLILSNPYDTYKERKDCASNHYTKESINYKINKDKITKSNSKTEKKFTCYISGNFNASKPTVIYFHVNGGFSFDQVDVFKNLGYNVVAFPFYGYGSNLGDGSLKNVNLENLTQQSELIVESLEEKLRGQDYYGNNYDRQKHLTFIGRSLGTLVATKLAAKMEKEGKPIKSVVNLVSIINMNTAIKTCIYRLTAIYIPVTLCFLACYMPILHYMINFLIQYYNTRNVSQGEIIKNTVLASIFFALLPTLVGVFCQEAKSIGISKDDINELKQTNVKFVFVENDVFCNEPDLDNFLKGSGKNITKDKIIITKDQKVVLSSNGENHILTDVTLEELNTPFRAHNSFVAQDEALKIILR